MAAGLISRYTSEGDRIFDPFSGAGTIALEAWTAGCDVVANDLSPYAFLLTRAKLHPYNTLESALVDIKECETLVQSELAKADLRQVPPWVKAFFNVTTLREIIAWVAVLKKRDKYFLLACLLGILHHQRPGFLSFPSSHTVPYLRLKKFPRRSFPQMYEHRPVLERLEAKVGRAFKRFPTLDMTRSREVFSKDSAEQVLDDAVDTIITSPPYMRQLHYGRDNRLRLWFLGTPEWNSLDSIVSPGEISFLMLMHQCLTNWKLTLKKGGLCVLIVGDAMSKALNKNLASFVTDVAVRHVGGYCLVEKRDDSIPDVRRVRRKCRGA